MENRSYDKKKRKIYFIILFIFTIYICVLNIFKIKEVKIKSIIDAQFIYIIIDHDDRDTIFDLNIGFYVNGATLEDINIYCAGSEEEKKCYSEIANIINKKSGIQFIGNNTLIFDRKKYRNGTVSIATRTTNSTRRKSKYYSFCFDDNDKFIYDDENKNERTDFLEVCNGNFPL